MIYGELRILPNFLVSRAIIKFLFWVLTIPHQTVAISMKLNNVFYF